MFANVVAFFGIQAKDSGLITNPNIEKFYNHTNRDDHLRIVLLLLETV